jgi:hypothetical protein
MRIRTFLRRRLPFEVSVDQAIAEARRLNIGRPQHQKLPVGEKKIRRLMRRTL